MGTLNVKLDDQMHDAFARVCRIDDCSMSEKLRELVIACCKKRIKEELTAWPKASLVCDAIAKRKKIKAGI